MSKKVMKLIDSKSGLMKCKVCGAEKYGGTTTEPYKGSPISRRIPRWRRGSWQCINGCKLPD
jgi:hypothetical protein